MGKHILNGVEYGKASKGSASETTYSNKLSGLEATNVQNAIDELNSKIGAIKTVTGTLPAGSRELTITDSAISTNSMIDIYTSVFGINPDDIKVSNGKIVLTFESMDVDIHVKVVLS